MNTRILPLQQAVDALVAETPWTATYANVYEAAKDGIDFISTQVAYVTAFLTASNKQRRKLGVTGVRTFKRGGETYVELAQ